MTLAVCLGGNVVLYRGAADSLRQEVREGLRRVATTAALQIDPLAHEQIHTPRDELSDNYKKIKTTLAEIRKANPGLRYVYTMRKTGRPDVWQFVVDGEQDPKLVSHVGDQYDVGNLPEMEKAFYGPTADEDLTTDQWGSWLSG